MLNAFRHHRVLRQHVALDSQLIKQCSTPFGITGCYALRICSVCSRWMLCSTPFGITGCYAINPLACLAHGKVLNAFRHHRVLRDAGAIQANRIYRCSTPFGITGCYALPSSCSPAVDSVLNAFRHHRVLRPRTNLTPWPDSRAQRLSASQGATRRAGGVGAIDFRCSTPFGITGCYALCRRLCRLSVIGAQRLSASQGATRPQPPPGRRGKRVLNAFRHHRVLRQGLCSRDIRSIMCSTPFGITGCYARRSGWRNSRPAVMCSTPFGITGCYAPAANSRAVSFSSAQRLSASQGATRFPVVVRQSRCIGAQRLSASQGATHLGAELLIRDLECSTPFGITGCYADDEPEEVLRPGLCSTPFGITGCYARETVRLLT